MIEKEALWYDSRFKEIIGKIFRIAWRQLQNNMIRALKKLLAKSFESPDVNYKIATNNYFRGSFLTYLRNWRECQIFVKADHSFKKFCENYRRDYVQANT